MSREKAIETGKELLDLFEQQDATVMKLELWAKGVRKRNSDLRINLCAKFPELKKHLMSLRCASPLRLRTLTPQQRER